MIQTLRTIKEHDNLGDTRVLLRAELNVPIIDGVIQDDFRLKKALTTIEYLQKEKARIIIIAHIADDSGGTLEPVAAWLKERITATFVSDVDDALVAVDSTKPGDVVLVENLRTHPGEKKNDREFAQQLATLGDCFVNDAFSVSHRPHASIVGIPQLLPSYVGLQFVDELSHLSRILDPVHPFVFVLGGMKFETKLPLIKKYLEIADMVFVGGALANGFFEKKGYSMEGSITPEKDYGVAQLLDHPRLKLPLDVGGPGFAGKKPEDVLPAEAIFDAGPETIAMLKQVVADAALVVWNGPIGDYKQGFVKHNNELARAIAECPGQSIVGGGDTVAAIRDLNLSDKFTFLSTAGGAMLQFLSDGTLPGIVALEKAPQ